MEIVSGNDYDQRDPQNFRLLGSNGDGFKIIQRWTEENFNARFQSRTFDLNNTNAYKTYRLEITKNKGNNILTQLSELDFFGCEDAVTASAVKSRLQKLDIERTENVNAQVSIYPNPISEYAIFDTSGLQDNQPIEIQIYDGNGRLVRSIKDILRGYSSGYRVDFNGFMPGIYVAFIKLKNGSSIIKKLAVK